MTAKDLTIDITGNLELGVHDAMRHFVQHLQNETGLRVDSVDVEWIETSSVGSEKASAIVSSLRIVTTTK